MRLVKRSIIAFGILQLAAACGDESVGGFHSTTPDAAGGTDTSDAGTPGIVGADEAGTKDNGTCAAASNGTSQGCEFYSVAPPVWPPVSGSCFAAVIVNPGATPVAISVDIDGTSLDVSQMARIPHGSGASMTYEPLPSGRLPGGQAAMLFLSRYDTDEYLDDNDCPKGIVPGLPHDPAIAESGRAKAFHITTDGPVAAFDIFPYGGRAGALESATLLIPTHVWGKSYIAADPYQADKELIDLEETCTPFLQIVAAEDDTNVTIRPTADIIGGPGVPSAPANTPHSYKLAKGEVLQFQRSFQVSGIVDAVKDRLMGSPISSDKPISIWGGAPGVYSGGQHQCDSSHQQIPPTTALGFEYVAARYRDRTATVHESVPWTLIGVADGTTLTYDPAPPDGAPTTLSAGQIAIFNAPEAFSVRSADNKHPFYFAGHMLGFWAITNETKPKDGGEPEFVNAIPPEQWLKAYSFITDPTFRNTNLVFVRTKGADGAFKDVTLDCAGPLTGWAAVGAGGQYEVARIDLATKGVPAGQCDNGLHSAKSDAPFSVTVWGWDDVVSYAYPVGGGVRAINDVPPPK